MECVHAGSPDSSFCLLGARIVHGMSCMGHLSPKFSMMVDAVHQQVIPIKQAFCTEEALRYLHHRHQSRAERDAAPDRMLFSQSLVGNSTTIERVTNFYVSRRENLKLVCVPFLLPMKSLNFVFLGGWRTAFFARSSATRIILLDARARYQDT